MQKTDYDRKNLHIKLLTKAAKYFLSAQITYLFSALNLFENDLSLSVGFVMSLSFYDRKFLGLGFVIALCAAVNGDVVFMSMAAISVFIMMVLCAVSKRSGDLAASIASAAVSFSSSFVTYSIFSLSDGYLLTGVICSAMSFIAASIFSRSLSVMASRRDHSRFTGWEEICFLASLSLIIISTKEIKIPGINIPIAVTAAAVMYFGKVLPDRCLPFAFLCSSLSVIFLDMDLSTIIIVCSLGFVAVFWGNMKRSLYFAACCSGIIGMCAVLGLYVGDYLWECIFAVPLTCGITFTENKLGIFAKPVMESKQISLSDSMDIMLSNEISLNKNALRCIRDNVNLDESESDIYRDICRIAITEVCMQCENYPICWLECGEETFEKFVSDIDAITGERIQKGNFNRLCDEDRKDALSRIIQYTFLSLRSQQDYKSKISRFLRIYRSQISYLCDMLDTVNMTIRKNLGFYSEASDEMLSLMNDISKDICDVVLTSDSSGGLRAVIKADLPLGDNTLRRDIRDVLKQYTKRNFAYSYVKEPSGNEKYLYVYEEEYERNLKVGSCCQAKEGEDISGDSILIKDFSHMQLCAICDGMGSGADAGKRSRKVINMLDGLLSAGYDYQNVVELINCVLTFGGDTEIFTTLDMLLFDRKTSSAVFFKAGAESAYIKRGEEIIKIKSETLPIGILESTHAKAVTMTLCKGDYVYMFSDGLLSTFGYNEEYIRTLISNSDFRFPQKIADNILKCALDAAGGIAKDDISVIVCKLR